MNKQKFIYLQNIFVIFILFFTINANSITWYNPQYWEFEEEQVVILSGKTQPNIKVEIDLKNSYRTLRNNNLKIWDLPKSLVSSKKVTSDPSGYFQFLVKLPEGAYNIIIKVGNKNIEKKFLLTGIEVSAEGLQISRKARFVQHPLERKSIQLGIAQGVKQSRFRQRVNTLSDLQYETAGTLITEAHLLWKTNPRWSSLVTVNNSSYTLNSTQAIQITNKNYSLVSGSFESIYNFPRFNTNALWSSVIKNKVGLIFGYQLQQVPFLIRTSKTFSTSSSTTHVSDIHLITLGIRSSAKKGYWIFNSAFKYLQSVSSTGPFNLKPKIGFNYSLGLYYEKNKNWKPGFSWSGDMLKFDHSHTDIATNTKLDGTQTFFTSDFKFELGYTF